MAQSMHRNHRYFQFPAVAFQDVIDGRVIDLFITHDEDRLIRREVLDERCELHDDLPVDLNLPN